VDLNKVFLTGIVESEPALVTMSGSGTPMCYFTVRVDEKFLADGKNWVTRPNYFRVECLGKQATSSFKKVKFGGRYFIDGYLRQENSNSSRIDIVKIRSYGVVLDQTPESHHYKMGLKKALGIISMQKDLTKAISMIEDLLVME
jgi:primosomal replication protein N